MTSDAAARNARRRLNKRTHRPDEPVIFIEQLEIDGAARRNFKVGGTVLFNGRNSEIDLGAPGERGGHGKRLI